MSGDLEALRRALSRNATRYDRAGAWPDESLTALQDAGAWKWVIARRYGGLEREPIAHLEGYEAIAAGCMSTLLILANRDGACELIAASENEAIKEELLPKLAENRLMASVGISQLTTSHQSGPPALAAQATDGGFVLNGFMPWVTSALKCRHIVTGALLPDGMQVLLAVPTEAAGMSIEPPMELMAMQGTLTSLVRCRQVLVEHRYVLRGPALKVLATRSGVKPSLVAASGVGLAAAMIEVIGRYASGPWQERLEQWRMRHAVVRRAVFDFAMAKDSLTDEKEKTRIRIQVNDLLVRLAAAVLTFTKGTGLVKDHDAQRLVREALFFLVWAAPEDVRAGTLDSLLKSD